MPNPQSPFKSDYSNGSQTTSRPGDTGHSLPLAGRAHAASQTDSVDTVILPPVDQLIEIQRYGTGKPTRVVIRGRITRE
jgi:hypothetical protein